MKKKDWFKNMGGITAIQRVSFVGWWVVGGEWCTFFRPHSGSELSIYPSYTRPSAMLRSESVVGSTRKKT